MFKKSESYEGYRLIVGDYNIALSSTLDRNTSRESNPHATNFVNEYLEQNGLVDVWRVRNPNRKQYSWSRNKPTRVASRLDYIVCDQAVATWFKYIAMKQSFRTDHLLVEAQIDVKNIIKGPGLWKFNTSHLRNKIFVEHIDKVIQEEILNGKERKLDPQQLWEHIKLTIIHSAQVLSRKISSEIKLIENQLREGISKLQEEHDLSEGDTDLLERSIADLESLMSKKAQGAIMRSKARWYNEGERSSKYFFALEKSRSGGKNISVLINDENKEITNPAEILAEMSKFYSSLYTSDPQVVFNETNQEEIKINANERNSLEGLITINELTAAAKELNRNKAPGTDGLPIEIYIVYWNRIKNILLEALNHAYSTGKLHNSALQGVISLIPKAGKDLRYIRNLRPITLLNTDYKLLEKCLANRLKPVLVSIINEDQKGFMADRRINNNIRRILDAVIYCESHDKPITVLSIDAEKAFDRVEIPALTGAMKYFGIGDSFQKWTQICFKDAEAMVINFGYTSKKFKVTRGVKQGGCCSAFYFLLLVEVLANKLRNSEKIVGLDINGVSKLLGQFADDLDLYLWGEKSNIQEALRIVQSFQNSSGMKINIGKSSLLRLGQNKNNLDLDIKEVEQVNVLGVEILSYIDDNKLLEINYSKTIEKTKAILKQWQGRKLSLLGKVLVINALVGSLFVYKMTVLPPIPDKYVKMLNDELNLFLWNGNRPKIPLQILQLPKKCGGAGLVDFRRKDVSLKFSWIKNILSDSFVEHIAYSNINFTLKNKIWECNLRREDVESLNIKNSFWRAVLEAWCELNYSKFVPPDEYPYQFIWYNSHIRINNKPCFFKKPYQNGLEIVLQLFHNDGKLKSAEEISAEFDCSIFQINQVLAAIPKEWRHVDVIANPEEVEQLYDKVQMVNKCAGFAYRKLAEKHSAIGLCLRKWQKTFPEVEVEAIEKAFVDLYRNTNSVKLRSLQYRLLHNALIFNTQLFYWKMSDTKLCSNCNKENENVFHFFWGCEFAQKLWEDVEQFIAKKCNVKITLTAQSIIFGETSVNNKSPINTIILATKTLMYSKRCLKQKINIQDIILYCNECREFERINAIKKEKENFDKLKWQDSPKIEEYVTQYLTGQAANDG